MQHDQQVIRFMREQRQRLDAVEREVERLRADVEGGARPSSARGGGAMEDRLSALEARAYGGTDPTGEMGALDDPDATVSVESIDAPPGDSAPPPTGLAGTWQTEVAAERAGAAGGPEREEYVQILDMLEGRDCGPASRWASSRSKASTRSPTSAC
jgi:hypothetical protein